MKPDLSDSLSSAKNLLGWKLVHKSSEGITSGYIVETEAYDMDDPASHAFGGMKARNAPMYRQAGTIYVYFTYGMHYCMNIVTGPKGRGQAVLIRALEPVEGIELMKKRRGLEDIHKLANGPAKLAQAMGIGPQHNVNILNKNGLYIEPGLEISEVTQTTRIGITRAIDRPWRFYISGNAYVSKR